MMDIYYKNNMGDVIDLLTPPYMLQTGDIFDYNWNYSNRAINRRGNKITGFQKEIKEFTLLLSILNSGRLQYYSAVNHFMEIVEIDVLANTPGELHVGEMYLKCYVTSSQKTEWESDIELLDNEITIVTDYPFWCKDKTYSFYTAPESIQEPPRYTHTAYAWSADGTDRFTVTYPGENLLLNSTGNLGNLENWSVSSSATMELISHSSPNGYPSIKVTDVLNATPRKCIQRIVPLSELNLENSKNVTYGFWYKASVGSDTIGVGSFIRLLKNGVNKGEIFYTAGKLIIDGNWHFKSITQDLSYLRGTELDGANLYMFALTGNVEYSEMKITHGDSAEPWTPSPTEDPENAYPTYMGIYSSDSSEQPTNPRVYTWSRIRAGETKPSKIDYPRDYPYGFITKYKPATRRVLRDYAFDYYKNHKIGKLDNDHFAETAFKLIVYGPCTHPEIRIGPNLYKVSATLYDSEYMVIDSRERTITKYGINGVQTNLFNSRDKGNYIFQKIPAGKQTVKWNAQYPFDVILYQERSEPAWSM